MPFLFHKKKILKENRIYFFISVVGLAVFSLLAFSGQRASAASETISCGAGNSRTLSVGTYTDPTGSQFSDGADLTLDLGEGGSDCTFTLNLDAGDDAINLASLHIASGVFLTTDLLASTDGGSYYKIHFNITGDFTLEAGADIDVTAKGMTVGAGGGTGMISLSPGYMSTFYGAHSSNGGAHGGYGGRYTFGSAGNLYDSVSNPIYPGGSGGGPFGASGGGVVIISAASATIDGNISADGQSTTFAADGAGGTVNLNVTGAIDGSGTITANGGAAVSVLGAGGGGRIALHYTTLSGGITLQAKGGDSSWSTSDGSAGTIYKKPAAQTYGDLVLDNGTASDAYYGTSPNYTVLPDDAVAEFGNAEVYNSLTLNNNAVFDISSDTDPDKTGGVNFSRKFFVVNACSADYNDDTLSNGQIQYAVGFVADPTSYHADYVCSAPQYVLQMTNITGSGKEDVTSGSFEVEGTGPAPDDLTVDYTIYAPSSTATNGVDYVLDNGTIGIAGGDTTNTVDFTINDDADQESDEDFVVELSNPSFGVLSSRTRFDYTIQDNDTPGVTLSKTTANAMEGFGTDSYTIVLDSIPTDDVIVSPHGDSHVTTTQSSLTFTAENWDVPQTVNLHPIDDHIADGMHTGIITHSVSSTDSGYEGIAVDSVTTTINDNDFASVTVTQSGGSTIVSENGATDSYTIVLGTIPASPVTVTISPDSATTVSTSSIIFTSANWNVPQTITVSGVDNGDTDGTHSSTISHTDTSDDSHYNSSFIQSVFASVIDNDQPGITATASNGTTQVREGGATDSYTIVLEKAPAADVTVSLSAGSEITISTDTLVFTPENWSTPQAVTVTAIDDADFEGSDSTSVSHTVTSDDPDYDGMSLSSVSVTVYDNDGFTVTQSDGSTDITEGSTTDTVDVVLDENPFSNVTITLSTSTRYTLSTTTLYFHSGDWDTPQTVEIDAVDNELSDGDVTQYVSSSISTFSFKYGSTILPRIPVNITDNDVSTPGVTIAESGDSTNVVEGADTDSYTIVLDTEPTGNVAVSITPDAQTTVSTSSIVFTTANWDTPQTVTVTAVDDFVAEGAHTSTITHTATSTDGDYNGIEIASVTAHITDNDSTAFFRSPISGNTTEAGGTASFTLALGSQPTANVYVPVASSDTTEGTVSTSSLTFTASNWSVPQTITVTGVDDPIVDGDISYDINLGPAVSVDAGYNNTSPAGLNLDNIDNDTAGVTIAESGDATNVTEGGATDTYTVVLNTQPTDDVTVHVAPDEQATVSDDTLVFTSDNWNVPQEVTVTAVDDNIDEGDHTTTLFHSVSSPDGAYNAIEVADVTVHITDNDTAGITASAISGATTEAGGTATFTVVLESRPTSNVNIPVSSSDTTEGTVSTSSLRFNPANWNTPRTVTVTGADDVLDDGNIAYTIVVGPATSTDGNFDGISASAVSVTNNDNDTSGVTVSQSGGTTNVTEGGATDSYTLVLDAQPTANVTVTITPDAQTTVSTSSIVFTSGNWNVAQTITVTAVNDNVAEGDHTSTIAHAASSADGNYNLIGIGSVTANITDNDTAGFTVSAISGNTSEAGGTATFTVVLTSQPTGTVTTTVHSSNTAEGSINTSTLVFNAASWNLARTVTVTGVNDDVVDGPIVYSIILDTATSTGDVNFAGINPNDVSITNTDNDTAGFTVSAISGNTNEAGGTATFTVVLTSRPTANVDVPVSSSDVGEGTVSTSSLRFNPVNWNIARTVTVTGVNDDVDDGDTAYSVVLAAVTSDDDDYDGINPNDVNVVNINDDIAGVTVAESGDETLITEAGATDSYTLVLDSQPTEDVTIAISSDENSTVSVDSLVFTADNWNVPQTVTVTAVDDLIAQGTHSSTITHTVTSDDTDYDGISVSDVSASITDDETAPVDATPVNHNGGGGTNGTPSTNGSDNTNTDNGNTNTDSAPSNAGSSDANAGTPDSGIPYADQTVVLGDSHPQEVKVGNEVHHVTNVSATDAVATIIIQSTPVRVTLQKNETKLVDTNGDTKSDMSVTYMGFTAGLPQFIFQDVTVSPDTRLVVINKEALMTTSTEVLLSFNVTSTPLIAISNTSSFAGVAFQPYRKTFFWTLTPGNGKKTVYVRFQRKNGYLFDASDSIELNVPETSIPDSILPTTSLSFTCEFALGKPFKTKDSPAVYLIDVAHDANGLPKQTPDCAKRIFPNPTAYFSYFASWSDIEMVTQSQINDIPDDALRIIPYGPRYTPTDGTLFKAVDDAKIYIYLGAEKRWIQTEEVFKAAGYLFNWVKTVVVTLVNSIPSGTPIDSPTQIPVDMLGKNTPTQISSSEHFTFTSFLKQGQSNLEVKNLQIILKTLGYLQTEATGYYGSSTTNAVKAFQRDHGLDQKGYVGPGTREVLNTL